MKKVCLICLMALIGLSCFSQVSVNLNEIKNGTKLFDIKDGSFLGRTGNYSYVIVPIEGNNQKDLYHKMILGLNNVYMDVDKVVSKIEPDAITINAYHTTDKSPNCIFIIDRTAYKLEGFKYRFSFKFKDGKVRIDSPIVTTVDYSPMLDKNRKLQGEFQRIEGLHSQLSNLYISVNDIISKILLSSYNSNKDDDW